MLKDPRTPLKGSLWVRRNYSRRENGVDVECVYRVTSVRADGVYLVPTWDTPGKVRPYMWPFEPRLGTNDFVVHRSFADTFDAVTS